MCLTCLKIGYLPDSRPSYEDEMGGAAQSDVRMELQ